MFVVCCLLCAVWCLLCGVCCLMLFGVVVVCGVLVLCIVDV